MPKDPKAIEIIKQLMQVLPDHTGGNTWTWCWEELSDEAQEKVKTARHQAHTFLISEGEL